MFEIGEKIVYGHVGICCVEAIGPAQRPMPGADPARLYYTLRPLHDSSMVYTPVDSPVYMRPVMDAAAAEALIASLPAAPCIDCPVTDHRQLADHYRSVVQTYQGDQLLRLLKTLWQRQQACRAKGKPLGKVDRQFQQTTEKFLFQELACALDTPVEQIADRIHTMLEEN